MEKIRKIQISFIYMQIFLPSSLSHHYNPLNPMSTHMKDFRIWKYSERQIISLGSI